MDRWIGLIGGVSYAIVALLIVGIAVVFVAGLWMAHPLAGIIAGAAVVAGGFYGWKNA